MLEVEMLGSFLLTFSYSRYVEVELFTLREMLATMATLVALAMDLTHMFSQLRLFLKVLYCLIVFLRISHSTPLA